jgi:CDP-diacylglycerol--glycerol-3-phosphate 3-phosphatidyltransferase
MRINIPNQITLGRLVLAIVFFVLLSFYSPGIPQRHWLLTVCFWIFLVAVLTDILDGWLARTWKQVTSFGRICDPVVDKVLVCGAFVFFATGIFYDSETQRNVSGVQPWMVVLILVRELLVSAIRSFAEAQGTEFAAIWVGKAKMFVQSASVCAILGVLAWHPQTLAWLRELCVWVTVVVTGLSIIAYVNRARAFILSAAALGATGSTAASSASEYVRASSSTSEQAGAGDSAGARD